MKNAIHIGALEKLQNYDKCFRREFAVLEESSNIRTVIQNCGQAILYSILRKKYYTIFSKQITTYKY